MPELNAKLFEADRLSAEANELFEVQRQSVFRRTDRLFAGLMAFQWMGGIAAALFIAPKAWVGSVSYIHPHVWVAIVIGGLISIPPILLAIFRPGSVLTRYTVSVCQALTSALLIHLSGGRIETHFHVFGSLAFLSFYRDWRILIPATIVTAADHYLRGVFYPQSVYGILTTSPWRWLEHAGWVIFEDVFLIASCIRAVEEMRAIAQKTSETIHAKEEADRARDLAQAASDAKSRFLANMSHEIRTPINGVIGMTDLLIRKGGLDEQQRRYAGIVRSSADSLLSLVNDILDFSKIEAGKLELSPVEFDVRSTVEDVVEMLAPKADSKGVAITCNISSQIPLQLVGDPDRLRQILINLVSNAIKFTEIGQVIVHVNAISRDQECAMIEFAVSDTGLGIPQDRLDRLFKSFSQIDASTTRKFGGTGLGLAIAKQLVELMGGTIDVKSEAGKGSTFRFTARFGTVRERDMQSPSVKGMKGLRVLIVDDQPVYREVLRDQFHAWRMDAHTASSGNAALTMLRDAAERGNAFHVAIIDMVMPEMDGPALARTINGRHEYGNPALLLVTAMDNQFDAEAMKASGFAACLTKPVRQSVLFDSLVRALHQQTPTAHIPAAPAARSMEQIGASILLAEDNEVNQEVARDLLCDAGCTVDIVSNGEAAVDAVRQKSYDLILMDCQMPRLDGFQATSQIRLLDRGRTVPIIALTANAIQGDRERCMAAGMNQYVTKPIDADLLLTAIRTMLKNGTRATPTLCPSTDAPTPIDTPLDMEALLRRCRGKTALVENVLKMFTDSLDQQLSELRDSANNADWDGVARVAHSLKGASANLSANAITQAATTLEQLGKSADATLAREALTNLDRQIREFLEFLPTATQSIDIATSTQLEGQVL
ncbi:MAG: response regulator [Phycisphaerae bacterium]|nr:response regulator [Phycisphaerae bacterium]